MKTESLKDRIDDITSILKENLEHFTNKRPIQLAIVKAEDFMTIHEHREHLNL